MTKGRCELYFIIPNKRVSAVQPVPAFPSKEQTVYIAQTRCLLLPLSCKKQEEIQELAALGTIYNVIKTTKLQYFPQTAPFAD